MNEREYLENAFGKKLSDKDIEEIKNKFLNPENVIYVKIPNFWINKKGKLIDFNLLVSSVIKRWNKKQ